MGREREEEHNEREREYDDLCVLACEPILKKEGQGKVSYKQNKQHVITTENNRGKTGRRRETAREIQAGRQRQAETETDKQTERGRETETDIEKGRKADKTQIDRQRDRQTER